MCGPPYAVKLQNTADFDQTQYEKELRRQSIGEQSRSSTFKTGLDKLLSEGHKAKFREWVLDFANVNNNKPAHVVGALNTDAVKLPSGHITFQDQLAIVCSLSEQGKLKHHVFRFLKTLILTNDNMFDQAVIANASQETVPPARPPSRGQTKTARRKGSYVLKRTLHNDFFHSQWRGHF